MKRFKKTQKFKNTNIKVPDAIHTPMYFSFNEDNREFHIRVDHARLVDEEPYDVDDFKRLKFDDLPNDLQNHIEKMFDKINDYLLTTEEYQDAEQLKS